MSPLLSWLLILSTSVTVIYAAVTIFGRNLNMKLYEAVLISTDKRTIEATAKLSAQDLDDAIEQTAAMGWPARRTRVVVSR